MIENDSATKERKWKLSIKGSLIVPSATFQDADILFSKSMKAIAETWDIDVQGQEVIKNDR